MARPIGRGEEAIEAPILCGSREQADEGPVKVAGKTSSRLDWILEAFGQVAADSRIESFGPWSLKQAGRLDDGNRIPGWY